MLREAVTLILGEDFVMLRGIHATRGCGVDLVATLLGTVFNENLCNCCHVTGHSLIIRMGIWVWFFHENLCNCCYVTGHSLIIRMGIWVWFFHENLCNCCYVTDNLATYGWGYGPGTLGDCFSMRTGIIVQCRCRFRLPPLWFGFEL